MNKYRLILGQADRFENMYGSDTGGQQPAGLLPGQGLRLRHHGRGRYDDFTSVGTRRVIRDHLITDRHRTCRADRAGTDRGHHAGRLDTEPQRQVLRIGTERTAVHLVVEGIDTGRTDRDAHLLRLRDCDADHGKDLGASIGRRHNCRCFFRFTHVGTQELCKAVHSAASR
ncbi:hypothetical protein ACFRK5_14110 [Streptomyces niveus]|uniref:hypothetical protein n=1 Tax=Streptomyces niveus TaxID=193462 RepID=UPI0036915B0C